MNHPFVDAMTSLNDKSVFRSANSFDSATFSRIQARSASESMAINPELSGPAWHAVQPALLDPVSVSSPVHRTPAGSWIVANPHDTIGVDAVEEPEHVIFAQRCKPI